MRSCIAIFVFLSGLTLKAQFLPDFYFYKNQQINLTPVPNRACVYTNISNLSDFEDSLNSLGYAVNFFTPDYVSPNEYFAEITGSNLSLSILKSQSYINTSLPCYLNSSSDTIGVRRNIYVQLSGSGSYSDLNNYANNNNLKLEEFEMSFSNWYMLSIPDTLNLSPIEIAREIYLQPFCQNAEPDFVVNLEFGCSNDPFFFQQWNLEDSGQADPSGGSGGYGINYCGAKQITQGKSNVLVGIFDLGVDKNHEDIANLSTTSIDVNGSTLSSPSQVYFDGLGNHGTPVAGIIGANSDNNIGTSGIAPNCMLVDISAPSFASNANVLTEAFKWAADNGVQVLNCSWRTLSQSSLLEQGIQYALDNGRNGSGCLIVFAAGNNNSQAIWYPGNSIDELFVAGGSDQCGYRAQTTQTGNPSQCVLNTTSAFGGKLDVMAPCQLIPTTDFTGPQGYQDDHLDNEPNYIIPTFPPSLASATGFNGTSSAAPHVSGVIALMLSVNPCLSLQQVDSIIAVTAQKAHQGIGFGFYQYNQTPTTSNQHTAYTGWHQEMGYGIIDAEACVLAAQSLDFACSSKCSVYDIWDEVIEVGQNQNTEIWSPTTLGLTEYNIRGEVVIPNGKTLIIEDGLVVRFSDSEENIFLDEFFEEFQIESGIKVLPGGKLIVRNNAVLSSVCERELWDGIELFGSANLPQIDQNQGVIEINTGGTIENARNAISVYGRDDDNNIDWNSTGGIVRANNAAFKNNYRALEFLRYESYNGINELINNKSSIKNCQFVTDAELNSGIDPYAFVTMYGVYGVSLQGNSFSNSANSPTQGLGSGIISIDARYNVEPSCNVITPFGQSCPSNQKTISTFSNLSIGISSSQGGALADMNVHDCEFDNCNTGISVAGSFNHDIYDNTFNVKAGDFNFPRNPSHYGIYSLASSGTSFEGNTFNHIGSNNPGRDIAIASGYNVVGSQEVYRNTTNGMETGVQSFLSNTGLQIDCNTLNRTNHTIADIYASGISLNDQGAIVLNDDEAAVANIFNGACDQNTNDWQIRAGESFFPGLGNGPISFDYNSLDASETNYDENCIDDDITVNAINGDLDNACPVQIPNQNPVISVIELQKQSYQQELTELNQLKNNMDAGNDPSLFNSISNDADWQIKNNLLSESPNLSDPVLIALLDKQSPKAPDWLIDQIFAANAPISNTVLLEMVQRSPKLPDWLTKKYLEEAAPITLEITDAYINSNPADWALEDVLLANTPLTDEELILLVDKMPPAKDWLIRNVMQANTPLSSGVWDAINNHSPAYPNWVINAISNSTVIAGEPSSRKKTKSDRDALEGQINFADFSKNAALSRLVRTYLDTNWVDSALNVLNQDGSLVGKCLSLPLASFRDTVQAAAHITAIRTAATLKNQEGNLEEADELNRFCDFYQTLMRVNKRPGGIYSLQLEERNTLQTLANSSQSVATNAQALLNFLNEEVLFEDVPPYPLSTKNAMVHKEVLVIVKNNINLYPNPTNNICHLEGKISTEGGEYELQLTDARGNLLEQQALTKEFQTILNLENYVKGMYFMIIKVDGVVVESKRLVKL